MKAIGQRIGIFLGAATAVTALYGMPATAFADGGTIHIFGTIVAPQFAVSTSTTATSPLTTRGVNASQDHSATTVAFAAQPGTQSGAEVALQVKDGATWSAGATALDKVATRFVDSSGHAMTSQNGEYHLTQTGGMLSLAGKPAGAAAAPQLVTVLVSYD
jgi:hypothetical protein